MHCSPANTFYFSTNLLYLFLLQLHLLKLLWYLSSILSWIVKYCSKIIKLVIHKIVFLKNRRKKKIPWVCQRIKLLQIIKMFINILKRGHFFFCWVYAYIYIYTYRFLIISWLLFILGTIFVCWIYFHSIIVCFEGIWFCSKIQCHPCQTE